MNTIFEFNGCEWHGCNKCHPNGNIISDKTKKPYGELYIKSIEKKDFCINQGYKYVSIWGCEWKKLVKSNEKMNEYINMIKKEMEIK